MEGTGGLRGAAPNEVRSPSLAGGRGLRRPRWFQATARQISHAIPPRHESMHAQKPQNIND